MDESEVNLEATLTEEQLDTVCILHRCWRTVTPIEGPLLRIINVNCLKGIRRAEESGPIIHLMLQLMQERGTVPRPLFRQMLNVLATYVPGASYMSQEPPFYHEKHDMLADLFLEMYDHAQYPEEIMSILVRALAKVPNEKVQMKFKMLRETKEKAASDTSSPKANLMPSASGRLTGSPIPVLQKTSDSVVRGMFADERIRAMGEMMMMDEHLKMEEKSHDD